MSASIAARWRAAAARLKAAGADTPDLDARLLAAHCLGLTAEAFFLAERDPFPQEHAAAYEGLIARREGGEPVARILGVREFHGLDFELAPATLVPRPDTETLVEAALALIAGTPSPLIVDLGTGSGAIAVAILKARADARALATDISPEAAETARRNAMRHGVEGRILAVAGDWGAALGGGFDLVVSNPPYIAENERAGLSREVRDHEPLRALFAGADGLDAYRVILPQAAGLLAPGGAVAVEIGHMQAAAVTALAKAAGLTDCRTLCDLAGRDRVVTAKRA
ncbi:MAG: peptide chain release factor N(5)-glutamine methyltransferase [Flavobacteriaceae bacterium]